MSISIWIVILSVVTVKLCDSACTNCTGTCAQLNFPNTNIDNIHQNTTINGVTYSSKINQQALTQCNNCPFTAEYPASDDQSIVANILNGQFIGVFSCPIAMCVCIDASNSSSGCFRGNSSVQLGLFPVLIRGTTLTVQINAVVLRSELFLQYTSNSLAIASSIIDAASLPEDLATNYNYTAPRFLTINHIACVNSTTAATADICPNAAPVSCAATNTTNNATSTTTSNHSTTTTHSTTTSHPSTTTSHSTTSTSHPSTTTSHPTTTTSHSTTTTHSTTTSHPTTTTSHSSTTTSHPTTTTSHPSTTTSHSTTTTLHNTTTSHTTTTSISPANSTSAIGPVCNTTNASMTPAQRQAAVNQENSLRSMLAKGLVSSPTGNLLPGTNIYQMTYSCSLEATAQAWANNCNFVHSHGPYGENLYIATGAPTTNPLTDAGADWWSEAAMTGLDDPTTAIFDTSDTASGHFTQMAWGLTTSFGCGYTYCSTSIFGRPATLVVCQYLAIGNIVNKPIYTVGATCTTNGNCNALPSSVCNVTSGLCMTT